LLVKWTTALLHSLAATPAMLGAMLFGIGTAHAYTANEEEYLNQLSQEQVPGRTTSSSTTAIRPAITCGMVPNRGQNCA